MKKVKCYPSDLSKNNIFYHAFQRIKTIDNKKGYRYIIDKPLTDETRRELLKFKNVILSSCTLKYAPEIKYDTIILID